MLNPSKLGEYIAAKLHGKSPNDQLRQGPDLTNNLADILLRFSKGAVGVVAVIVQL